MIYAGENSEKDLGGLKSLGRTTVTARSGPYADLPVRPDFDGSDTVCGMPFLLDAPWIT